MASPSQQSYWLTRYPLSCDWSCDTLFTPCFIQCDLASEGFLGNINQLDEYCREKGFHAWFETSAKENIGIDEAARSLVAKVSHSESYHILCYV